MKFKATSYVILSGDRFVFDDLQTSSDLAKKKKRKTKIRTKTLLKISVKRLPNEFGIRIYSSDIGYQSLKHVLWQEIKNESIGIRESTESHQNNHQQNLCKPLSSGWKGTHSDWHSKFNNKAKLRLKISLQ